MQFGQRGVGEENEREFAGRATHPKIGPIRVENRDGLRYITSFNTKTRMPVGDGDGSLRDWIG